MHAASITSIRGLHSIVGLRGQWSWFAQIIRGLQRLRKVEVWARPRKPLILRKHRSAQHQRFAQNYNGPLASLFTVHAVLCPVSPRQRLKIRVLGFDMET